MKCVLTTRNPNAKTIESDLLDAMVDAGVIPQDAAEDPGTKVLFPSSPSLKGIPQSVRRSQY